MHSKLNLLCSSLFAKSIYSLTKIRSAGNFRVRKFFIIAILLLMTSLIITSSATPSTQIWIPSTDIQGFLKPHLGWDVYITAYDATTVISNGGITVGCLL